jgi:hypothetical protein
MNEVTHILSWTPGWLIGRTAPGFWALRTAAAHEAGDPPEYDGADLPRSARTGELALVTESQVGFPVVLEAGEQQIKADGRLARWHTVPVFYARRAS